MTSPVDRHRRPRLGDRDVPPDVRARRDPGVGWRLPPTRLHRIRRLAASTFELDRASSTDRVSRQSSRRRRRRASIRRGRRVRPDLPASRRRRRTSRRPAPRAASSCDGPATSAWSRTCAARDRDALAPSAARVDSGLRVTREVVATLSTLTPRVLASRTRRSDGAGERPRGSERPTRCPTEIVSGHARVPRSIRRRRLRHRGMPGGGPGRHQEERTLATATTPRRSSARSATASSSSRPPARR